MFPQKAPPKPKKESDACEIEIRKTSHGKKIKFKGKCSREQISLLAKENNIDIEE